MNNLMAITLILAAVSILMFCLLMITVGWVFYQIYSLAKKVMEMQDEMKELTPAEIKQMNKINSSQQKSKTAETPDEDPREE